MYYHYTDINGLYEILQHKKLWLTDSRFLNEHTEGSDIFSYLTTAFRNLGLSGSDLSQTMNKFLQGAEGIDNYIASFSSEADLLSQWRDYCPNNGGYSLGFKNLDRENFDVFGNEQSLKRWLSFPQPCIYLEEQKIADAQKIANTLLEWLEGDKSKDPLKCPFMMQFHSMKMLYKSLRFQEENEIRAIVQIHKDPMAIPLFRTKFNLIVPYLNLTFQPEMLKEIIIGPSSNKELAKVSVQEFLKSLGPDYSHINIRHSLIPIERLS